MGLDGCGVVTVTQQAISQRFASCRRASSESRATKAVICRMKSMSTANAAYKANDFTAGIVLKAPAKDNEGVLSQPYMFTHTYIHGINLNPLTALYMTHSKYIIATIYQSYLYLIRVVHI